MNKRISLLLALVLLLLLPVQGFAQKTEAVVPVWTEENVRWYLQSYIYGEELDALYSYYDLQIRRYMPETTYRHMLTELSWLTGAFQTLGSYRCFEEEERGTMTHVVHLHMEKQDLEAYLTHKSDPEDRGIMALEFVPAPEAERDSGFAVDAPDTARSFCEISVCVGKESAYPLNGVITIPDGENGNRTVAGCVFIHDDGPLDQNETVGETHFFQELAGELALSGIASIRYDKRTFAYESYQPETVWDEVIEDALSAAGLLSQQPGMEGKPIFLLGHGFGASLLPRIAQEGSFAGMILIGSSPESYVKQLLGNALAQAATKEEAALLKEKTAALAKMDEQEAKAAELFGRNAYYLWDLQQHDPVKTIRKLTLPTYIVQGREDAVVTEDAGWKAYQDALKDYSFVSYQCYRGLNHMLARDLHLDTSGRPLYAVDAGIETAAVRDLAEWIRNILPKTDTMEVEE